MERIYNRTIVGIKYINTSIFIRRKYTGSSSGTTANFGAPTSFHRGQTGSQSSPLASQDEDIPSLAPSTVPETSRPATGTTPTFGPSTGFSGTFNNPNTLKPSSTIQQTVPSRGNRRPTTTPSFTTGPQETGATPEGSRTSPIRQPTSATRSVSRFTNTAPQNTQSTDSGKFRQKYMQWKIRGWVEKYPICPSRWLFNHAHLR